MQNKFLSKSVPRGTRTIWRYLGALFLLFTFAIGNVWAACPDTGTIYKFATKSTLTGNTNITDNPVSITTSNYLESFVGSTGASLTAYNDNKKFQIASNGMKLADKSKARLILNLGECTLKKGDIVKIKVTSQNSVLSTSTSADDKFLSISKNANEQTLVLEADVNASVVYLLATSNGAIVYSLEIIRPYNITLNANGGNVNGENSVEYGMMEAGILPRAEKESMRFVGWYDDPTAGTLKAGAFSKYTPTGNVTLYAHYADDCASSGEIYSFSINPKPAADIKAAAAAGSVVELVDYADCDGKGTASIGNNSANQYVYVKSSDGKVYLTGNNSYLKLELACPLEEGDEITFVKSQALKISYTYNAASGTTSSLASGTNTFTIPAESGWIGKRAIYCFYNSNGVNITSVSITRPAPVSTHTLTWDFDGGSTTSTTHTAAGQVAEGATITYPANNTMSKDSYDFAGWSTSATTMPNTDLTIVAQWTEHVLSDDATLSDLTVGSETVTGFAAATTAYNVELPFGTTAVPTVVGTANSTYAKSVDVTPAASLPGSTTVVVTAENNSTKTYTINFTVADSKLINLVWKTGQSACEGAGSQAAVIKSNNAAVSPYIKEITFENVEGSGDDAAEGGSLNTGKKAGNTIIIQTKPGYLFTTMSFYGKIETEDAKCLISIDGGENWSDLASTSGSDATYCNVVSSASTNDIRIKSAGIKGTWIRNMQLTITTGCSPVKLTWTAEPAAEYEVGKAASAIAATANNGGAVAYSTTASGIVNVAANGALTIAGLGSATLKAATAEGDGTAYCTNGGEDIVISKVVNTYYLVRFDAQNETAVNEVKYYAGDAAIATPVQPSYSGFVFQGWFDAASAGNAVAFPLTPESSRTIYAQWVAECTGPTINVHPASANYLTGRTASALTCEATAGAAGELTYTWYSCDDAERTNPVVLAGAPTPSTAVAGTFYYYCAVTEAGCDIIRNSNVATITIEDKEPVCIIKSIPTSGNDASVDGYYKGSAFFKGSNAKKLSSGYDYVGVQLMAGKSFLATDKVVLNQAADLGDASDITKFYVFTETPASGKSYAAVDNATPQKGDNWFAMPAELVGKSSFYIGRVDAKCNPTLGYLAVYRAMNPELIAIAIDERAGVIDPMDDKHFNVLIPYSADLADLSIVKTVAWNAPHATASAAVISNEGAWVIGDNTYRLMDKDGDYTDYTITLAREAHYEAKIGETGYATLVEAVAAAVDGDVVVLQENVAAGAGVMIAKADAKQITIDFGGYTYTANSPAVGSVGTQNQAFHFEKGCDITLKHGTIACSGSEIKMLIQNYGDLTLEDITLDGTGLEGSHRYVMSNNCGDVVIGNGTTITAKAGDVAFDVCATNYYPEGVTVTVKDGATVNGIVEYDVWGTKPADNKAELAIEGGTLNITWNVESALVEDAKENLNVSGGQFSEIVPADYCAEGYAPVTTPNAQGKYEVVEAGIIRGAAVQNADDVYYYTLDNGVTIYSSESDGRLKTSNHISNSSSDVIACGGDNVGHNVNQSKFVLKFPVNVKEFTLYGANSTERTISKVYDNAEGSEEIKISTVGRELTGTYTNTKDGKCQTLTAVFDDENVIPANYYVLVTLSGTANVYRVLYTEAECTTPTVTVADQTAKENVEVTLTANATALGATYQWYQLNGENYELMPGKTAKTLTVTKVGEADQFYKVVVGCNCSEETAEDVAKVSLYTEVTTLVDVTGNTVWDWSTIVNDVDGAAISSDGKKVNGANGILANYIQGTSMDKIESNNGAYAIRSNSNQYYQGASLHMHTTKGGILTIRARNEGHAMTLKVENEGRDMNLGALDNWKNYTIYVKAGDVTIYNVPAEGTYPMRVEKITFTVKESPDYPRDVTNNYGTLCVEHNVLAGGALGATFYQIASRNELYNDKIDFEEVMPGEELKAGQPYIFKSNTGKIELFYDEISEPANPKEIRGMIGNYAASTLDITEDNKLDILYIANNKLYNCSNLVGDKLILNANRAYIKMSKVPTYAEYQASQSNSQPNNARRRVTLSMNGTNSATDIDNIFGNDTKAEKVLINGQLFILRGGKMFDATGRLVK